MWWPSKNYIKENNSFMLFVQCNWKKSMNHCFPLGFSKTSFCLVLFKITSDYSCFFRTLGISFYSDFHIQNFRQQTIFRPNYRSKASKIHPKNVLLRIDLEDKSTQCWFGLWHLVVSFIPRLIDSFLCLLSEYWRTASLSQEITVTKLLFIKSSVKILLVLLVANGFVQFSLNTI